MSVRIADKISKSCAQKGQGHSHVVYKYVNAKVTEAYMLTERRRRSFVCVTND